MTTNSKYNSNQTNSYQKNSYSNKGKKRNNAFIKFLAIICLIAVTAIASISIYKANANIETLTSTYEITYVYHRVGTGESISYIAGLYIGDSYPGSFEMYQALICSENDIENKNWIKTGDMLLIPIYKEIATYTHTSVTTKK